MPNPDYVGKTAYYGEIASRYDEQRVTEPIWNVEQEFVSGWVRTLAPGATILDLPAGTGRFLRVFLERGLKVQARDISTDMLAEIHRRFAPLPAEVDVRVGDAEQLDLPSDAVDFVISWRFFHLIPLDVLGRVLSEFRRVCRGTVVVQVFGVRPVGWRRTVWQSFKDWARPAWRRLRPVDPRTAATPWAHITSYPHHEEDLMQAFGRAGLSVQDARTLVMQDGLANRVYFLIRRPVVAGSGPGT